MKMPMVATLAFGIALGAVLTVAADSGTTPDNSEIATLRRQVKAIEEYSAETTLEVMQKYFALETRVAELERRLAGRLPDPNGLTPRPSLPGSPVPKYWWRREFNGMPYYVIPLQHDPNRAARLRR